MGMFDDVLTAIDPPQPLGRVVPSMIAEIGKEYDGIPSDYLTFLCEVGFGDTGNFQVYSGPIEPSFIYPHRTALLSSIIIWGDDQLGYCYGFDRARNYRVVEISPEGDPADSIRSTFSEVIRDHVFA